MDLSLVVLAGLSGAILGDQLGYRLGKHGGGFVKSRIGGNKSQQELFRKAEEFMRRWGGPGVFFSRWLVSPLGPWVNLAGGMMPYRWPGFTLFAVMGEIVWVGLYVGLGYGFSGSVQKIADIAGQFSLLLAALIIAGLLGWRLRMVLHK